ncbi:hypothetical protein PAECIP111892_00268 [Paenibacillus auburnensis]|uniref:DUF3231 family protein n=1 Tax=Paenibacillus auburnensis TaxID=2905649 RepID=A0ABM9BPE4_9BACL|nr:DUF3231 family protein [Paenibacillus auburnensis]CAH1190615.1 hypothetical protein PAECIP111892_00268 [Paenibacillus auburnensis]
MGVLSGNSKDEPLHYGEIFNLWQFSASTKMSLSTFQAFHYHAGDQDLKEVIDNFIDQVHREIKECDKLLKTNGITPPPGLPDRPSVKLEDIPAGARFSDPEIAAALSAAASLGLVVCSQAMGTSIREDLGAMFMKFHAQMAALGLQVLKMNKKKGWLVPPPLQLKTREPVLV